MRVCSSKIRHPAAVLGCCFVDEGRAVRHRRHAGLLPAHTAVRLPRVVSRCVRLLLFVSRAAGQRLRRQCSSYVSSACTSGTFRTDIASPRNARSRRSVPAGFRHTRAALLLCARFRARKKSSAPCSSKLSSQNCCWASLSAHTPCAHADLTCPRRARPCLDYTKPQYVAMPAPRWR